MSLSFRSGLLAVGLGALILLIALAFVPDPAPVEVVSVTRGALQVTLEEEGRTRARERFVIAAPVSGRLARIELREGDPVQCDQLLAWIHLLPLDPRQQAEISERVEAALALQREADQSVELARASYGQARRERDRMARLAKDGLVTAQALEQAKVAEVTAAQELEAARFRADAAAHEVKIAQAGLMAVEARAPDASWIELRSPVQGRVLRLLEKSERVLPAGTPILEVGDPSFLEVIVDLLSTDAVKVVPAAPVLLEGWGGDTPLRGRVRIVEPAAFTKVSALGIEEQRVPVVIDLLDPARPLGDAYRVEAKIILWEAPDVLQAPASALFRQGQDWAVFALEQGRAVRRMVQIGHRNALQVEILAGLTEGTHLIAYPPDELRDGARVQPQSEEAEQP